MNLKKLLLYTTQLMKTGGIESHILEFCHHMADSGVSIDLVVPNFQMNHEEEARLKEACNKVYLYRSNSGWKRLIWLLLNANLFKAQGYDALYTNGQGESIALFRKLVGKPKVWVQHHHTSGDQQDQLTWGKNYLQALNAADVVIACSQRNAKKIQVILNRKVDSVPCFSRNVRLDEKSHRKVKKIRFGYYGRLIPEKGIDTLCRLSEDTDINNLIEIHIWGEGIAYPSSFFMKFPMVKYHGTFNGQKELENIINFLDAFLLLSTHPEGLPISLLESMSGGLPWLATDRGGIVDIALDQHSTRVIPTTSNYRQIREAILLFAKDIKEGKVSRTGQMKLYNQKFSASSLVSQWKEILCLEEKVAV